MCDMYCVAGFVKDENGCDTCQCVDPCQVIRTQHSNFLLYFDNIYSRQLWITVEQILIGWYTDSWWKACYVWYTVKLHWLSFFIQICFPSIRGSLIILYHLAMSTAVLDSQCCHYFMLMPTDRQKMHYAIECAVCDSVCLWRPAWQRHLWLAIDFLVLNTCLSQLYFLLSFRYWLTTADDHKYLVSEHKDNLQCAS